MLCGVVSVWRWVLYCAALCCINADPLRSSPPQQVSLTGTYSHTPQELEYGARVAWRNTAQCVGRITWNALVVRDRRHVTDPAEMLKECVEHLQTATTGPNVVTMMTVFRPLKPDETEGPRFWNDHFVQYAGYRGLHPDGGVLGDPATVEFTEFLVEKGLWQPPAKYTAYDILPLVLKVPGRCVFPAAAARLWTPHGPSDHQRLAIARMQWVLSSCCTAHTCAWALPTLPSPLSFSETSALVPGQRPSLLTVEGGCPPPPLSNASPGLGEGSSQYLWCLHQSVRFSRRKLSTVFIRRRRGGHASHEALPKTVTFRGCSPALTWEM